MIAPFTSGSLFFSNLGNHESDSPHSASYYDYTDSGEKNFPEDFRFESPLPVPFAYFLFIFSIYLLPACSPHFSRCIFIILPGGECGVVTSALLPLPYPATVDKPWWSYDVGLIHMMGMSSEHDYRVGSDQYKWYVLSTFESFVTYSSDGTFVPPHVP